MITIEIGNIFALNKEQVRIAMEILRGIRGRRLKKLYPYFLKNFEKKIQQQLTGSFPIAHAITYPNGKAFVDVTFLKKKRQKWTSPKVSGSAFFLRRLESKKGNIIKSGKIVFRDHNSGKLMPSELVPYEEEVKKRIKQNWQYVLKVLKHSKNPEEVGEHLLLLQFVKPTKEIKEIIYKCLLSEHEVVQNNAAFVLGNHLDKLKKWQFRRILHLLDSRFSAPINKGLFLLARLLELKIPQIYKVIIYQRVRKFIGNPQPNISDIAKMILEKDKR